MGKGYLFINRDLLCNEDYKCLSPSERHVFIQLLFMANFNEGTRKRCKICRNEEILKVGQVFGSIGEIMRIMQIKYSVGYRKLSRIQDVNLIGIETKSCHTVITICNYNELCVFNSPERKRVQKGGKKNNAKGLETKVEKDTIYTMSLLNKNTYVEIARNLAQELRDEIIKFDPDHKLAGRQWTSARAEKWTITMRRMLDLDKRNEDEIKKAIHWIYNNSTFWSGVVQSADGLRRNWDKISASRKREHATKQSQYNIKWADPDS